MLKQYPTPTLDKVFFVFSWTWVLRFIRMNFRNFNTSSMHGSIVILDLTWFYIRSNMCRENAVQGIQNLSGTYMGHTLKYSY